MHTTAGVAGSRTEAGPLLIPWGPAGTLDLRYPDGWPAAEVVRPDLSGGPADYDEALASALDAPGAWARYATGLRPDSKVALVVDDPSRWTPLDRALPAVLGRLSAAGVPDANVTVSVGVGRHHALGPEALAKRVGAAVAGRYRCFSPPLDDRAAYADLGTTPDGLPVRVFRPVAGADLRVLIGSVLPHLQAGFGGGYKLIFPGTSHRSTLGALHRRGIGPRSPGSAAGLLGGDAAANPMRRAIAGAVARLGPCLSVSHLLGPPGRVLRVEAGHPDSVQDALAAEARRRFRAPDAGPADVVVAGNHPWPGDPLQSFKALLHHRAACRAGGVLAGFFWTDPGEVDRSMPMPALRAIAAGGAPAGWALRRALAGADRVASALGLAAGFMIHWARELVVDRTVLVYSPPLRDRLGPRLGPVRLFDDPAALWRAAAAALPFAPTPVIRVFPQGGLTYVPELNTCD